MLFLLVIKKVQSIDLALTVPAQDEPENKASSKHWGKCRKCQEEAFLFFPNVVKPLKLSHIYSAVCRSLQFGQI